jgi:5'(3')-deoxyribonucleotidase
MSLLEICLDFDDVIKPLVVPWTEKIRSALGENVQYSDVKSFEFLGKPEYLALLNPSKFDHEAGEPEEGAVEVINRLVARGYTLHVISASQEDNISAKYHFLERHFPGIFGRKQRHWTHEKFNHANKRRILFDDATHNLVDWAKHDGIAVAFDRPWNQDWQGLRVSGFHEFEDLVVNVLS